MNTGEMFDPERDAEKERRASAWIRERERQGHDMTRHYPMRRIAAMREGRKE